jgi:hypothetical protein
MVYDIVLGYCFVNKLWMMMTFSHSVDRFHPWENIVRNNLSKLRSMAELWAFDGICLSAFCRQFPKVNLTVIDKI